MRKNLCNLRVGLDAVSVSDAFVFSAGAVGASVTQPIVENRPVVSEVIRYDLGDHGKIENLSKMT